MGQIKLFDDIDIFQEVGAGKGLRKQSTIGSIQSKDSHTEDPNEIANAFNELFFINIASKIKEPVENTSHEKLR